MAGCQFIQAARATTLSFALALARAAGVNPWILVILAAGKPPRHNKSGLRFRVGEVTQRRSTAWPVMNASWADWRKRSTGSRRRLPWVIRSGLCWGKRVLALFIRKPDRTSPRKVRKSDEDRERANESQHPIRHPFLFRFADILRIGGVVVGSCRWRCFERPPKPRRQHHVEGRITEAERFPRIMVPSLSVKPRPTAPVRRIQYRLRQTKPRTLTLMPARTHGKILSATAGAVKPQPASVV